MHGFLVVFFVFLVSCAVSVYIFWAMGEARYWKRAIRRFEEWDQVQPPQPGVMIFTGSSSINFWKTLTQDMAPLNVVNRGFGGSQMARVTHYAEKIILSCSPSAVVPTLPKEAVCAVVAAIIAGLVAFYSLIISKEQTISGFRQQWIDSFRADVAALVAYVVGVHGESIAKKNRKDDLWGKVKEHFTRFHELASRIRLRLNPQRRTQETWRSRRNEGGTCCHRQA